MIEVRITLIKDATTVTSLVISDVSAEPDMKIDTTKNMLALNPSKEGHVVGLEHTNIDIYFSTTIHMN